MKKHYYYFDCEDQDRLFEYLEKLSHDGSITYRKDESDSVITIYEIDLDDTEQRKMYKELDNYNVIEDMDYVDEYDVINEDMDDYRDGLSDEEDEYDF